VLLFNQNPKYMRCLLIFVSTFLCLCCSLCCSVYLDSGTETRLSSNPEPHKMYINVIHKPGNQKAQGQQQFDNFRTIEFFCDTAGRRAPCNKPPSRSKIICRIWLTALDRVRVEIFVVRTFGIRPAISTNTLYSQTRIL